MTLSFMRLEALPLGLTADDVMHAFAPFVCASATPRDYDDLTRHIRKKAMKKAVRRLWSGEGG